MSDPCNCDICGKRGRRRMGAASPAGWLLATIVVAPDGQSASVDTEMLSPQGYMIYACSHTCAAKFWQPGWSRRLAPNMRPVIRSIDFLECADGSERQDAREALEAERAELRRDEERERETAQKIRELEAEIEALRGAAEERGET